MPQYQFECPVCGWKRTGWYSYRDCPESVPCGNLVAKQACRGRAVKIVGGCAVVFKGRGFYSTDNRKAESRD